MSKEIEDISKRIFELLPKIEISDLSQEELKEEIELREELKKELTDEECIEDIVDEVSEFRKFLK